MKDYFKQLLNAAIVSAAQGAVAAGNDNAGLQTVGIAAGATGIAGILAFILGHPQTHPVVKQAVAKVSNAPAPAPATTA
jgi:hypothetical protein